MLGPAADDDAADGRLASVPRDLLEQLRLAWRFRGLDVRTVGDVTRLMTMSRRRPARSVLRVRRGQDGDVDQRADRHVGGTVRARHRLRDGAPLDRRRRRRHARLVGRARRRDGRGRRGDRVAARGRSAPRSGRTRRSRGSSRPRRGGARRHARRRRGDPRAAGRHGVPSEDHVPAAARSERAAGGLRARHRALVELADRRGEDQPARSTELPASSRPTRSWTDSAAGSRSRRRSRSWRRSFEEARAGTASTFPFTDGVMPDVARSVARAARASTSSRCSRSGCRTRGARSRIATSSRRTPTA